VIEIQGGEPRGTGDSGHSRSIFSEKKKMFNLTSRMENKLALWKGERGKVTWIVGVGVVPISAQKDIYGN